ncbi:NlpC/P60 family protein [Amorphus sp. MBR-141]
MFTNRQIQQRLVDFGYDIGRWGVDGVIGPDTEAAIVAFKRDRGLRARPYIGPITLGLLFTEGQLSSVGDEPWLNEITKYLNYHEVRDRLALMRWLKSDGRTLGDPSKSPWCGDAVETAVRLALPSEPLLGRVGLNPYLARNWTEFGVASRPLYATVGVFWRTHRTKSTDGHVGFLIGYDRDLRRFRVRGGNQSNKVCDAWLDEGRLLEARAPSTYGKPLLPLPLVDSTGAVISHNEA